MTVPSTTTRVAYAGDGTSVAFAVPYYFLANSDLVVLLVDADGNSTTQTLTTNYTVAGAGVPAGGTVTMLAAPASGFTLIIYRDPAVTQLTDYAPNDPFPAESHERALDRLTMIAQRQNELLTRSFRLADSDTSGADTRIPTPTANNVIGWNGSANALQNYTPETFATIVAFGTANADLFDGDGVTTLFTLSANPGSLNNLDISIDGVTQSPGLDYTWSGGLGVTFTSPPPAGTDNVLVRYMQGLPAGAVGTNSVGEDAIIDGSIVNRHINASAAIESTKLQFTQSGTGAVARSVQVKLQDTISVKDFGAVGDGVTNDRAAIVLAVAAAAGRRLLFPKGAYLVNTDGGTINLAGVTLVGEGQQEYGTPYDNNASVILITGTVNNPFTLGRGVSIEGLSFFYPNQIETGAAPVVYPALFTGSFITQFTFEDNTVINCYRFFELPSTGLAGDCRFVSNRIFAIDRVFQFSGGAPEVFFITDNIFSFGIYEDNVNVGPTYAIRTYYATSGEFMRVDCGAGVLHQSVDGLNMSNNLVFGCRYGIRVQSGRLDVSVIEGNKFDGVPTAIACLTTGTVNNTVVDGNLFYSYKFADTAEKASTIFFNGTGSTANLNITGNNFAFSQGRHIDITGTDTAEDVLISGNIFRQWARTTFLPAAQYDAIAIGQADLRVTVTANLFTALPAGANLAPGIQVASAASLRVGGNHFNNCYYALLVTDATKAYVNGNLSVGTVFTQSFINNDATPGAVMADGNFWDRAPNAYSYPFFIAAITAAQTFTGAKTKALFGGKAKFNEDLSYSIATSVYTVPIDGLYEFNVTLTNAAGVTVADVWNCIVECTGSSTQQTGAVNYVTAAAVGSCSFNFTAQFRLVAGDQVVVYMTRQAGAGNWTHLLDGNFNVFSGKKIQ